MIEDFIFSLMAGLIVEILFVLFSVIMLRNGLKKVNMKRIG